MRNQTQMAEYSLHFSEKLIECAQVVANHRLEDLDRRRTAWYLGLLTPEIYLKALIEKAGKLVGKINRRSHNL